MSARLIAPFLVLTLAGGILVTGCAQPSDKASNATSKPSATSEQPKAGTLANPLPVGSSIDATEGNLRFNVAFPSLNPNANDLVVLPGFVSEPAPGNHYVVLYVQMSNTSEDAAAVLIPGDIGTNITLTDQEGVSYQGSYAYMPDALDVASEAYPGQSVTGTLAFEVPDSTASLIAGYKGSFVLL